MYVSPYEITTVVIVITMIRKFFEVSSIITLKFILGSVMSPITIVLIFIVILSIRLSFITVKIMHIASSLSIVFFISIILLILLPQSNVFLKLWGL